MPFKNCCCLQWQTQLLAPRLAESSARAEEGIAAAARGAAEPAQPWGRSWGSTVSRYSRKSRQPSSASGTRFPMLVCLGCRYS